MLGGRRSRGQNKRRLNEYALAVVSFSCTVKIITVSAATQSNTSQSFLQTDTNLLPLMSE